MSLTAWNSLVVSLFNNYEVVYREYRNNWLDERYLPLGRNFPLCPDAESLWNERRQVADDEFVEWAEENIFTES